MRTVLVKLDILYNMGLTQHTIDLLVGTMLGDANLQTYSDGATWRYRALHKADHYEYLLHKYELLKKYCETGPLYGSTYDDRTGKTYERWYFNTLTNSVFKTFADAFYCFDGTTGKWVKTVPSNITDYLTPAAIAYWYMDDENFKEPGYSNAMRICTENFKLSDYNLLQSALLERYGIVTRPHKHKVKGDPDRKRMYIPEGESAKFRELIKPYLVHCMTFKVSDGSYKPLSP